MTFLTPLGGLAALAALLFAAAALSAYRRVDVVRGSLRLPAPTRRTALLRTSLVAAAIALLGLAATQPALTRTSSLRQRRDVQAVFVLDTSRSMAAAVSPRAPTRLDRAVEAAVRLRDAVPQVEAGVVTLTDRVLPDLLPVLDREGFTGVVERAVRIESPPPRATGVRATSYAALADIARGNVFAPGASRRIVVLLTDGESNPVVTGDLAQALPASRGYRFLAIRFWRGDESVYRGDGKPEAAYRPDASGRATLHDLAAALGGRSFEESERGSAASYLRHVVGKAPTTHAAGSRRRIALAPYLGLLCLLAFAAAIVPSRFRSRRISLTWQ